MRRALQHFWEGDGHVNVLMILRDSQLCLSVSSFFLMKWGKLWANICVKTGFSMFRCRNLPEFGCGRLFCHVANLTYWREVSTCDISLCLAYFETGIHSYYLTWWLRDFINNLYFTMLLIYSNRVSYLPAHLWCFVWQALWWRHRTKRYWEVKITRVRWKMW